MSFRFQMNRGLIVVSAELIGPTGNAIVRLALDTGATTTLLNAGILLSIGYDPAISLKRIQVTTGSGVEFVPQIAIRSLTTLGQTATDFEVLSHTLPPSAPVDGLLGLDFFREKKLSIDFRTGEIKVEI